MRPLSEYVQDAANLSVEAFAELHGHYFLVKEPSQLDVVRGEDFEFHTDHGPVSKILDKRAPGASQPLSGSEVVPVKKKPGNPWPRMISVGRTRSCDISLRYPNISKLHAIFRTTERDTLELIDQGSVNGTLVNGESLSDARELNTGDRLSFGGIELEFMDAPRLIEQVRLVHG